jgi:hypothetical protein
MEFDLAAWGINVATSIGVSFFTDWLKKRRSKKKAPYYLIVTYSGVKVELQINAEDIHQCRIIVEVGESTKNESKSENGV